MNKIPMWLQAQYNRAKKSGWIPMFHNAASKYGFTTEDLLGLSSRESNLQNIKGDFHDGEYHGFSLMQLDINSHRAWIEKGLWQDVQAAINKGAEALAEKRDLIVRMSKQPTCVIKFRSGKSVRFTPKPFSQGQLRQITIAAYNCGMAAYYHFSIGNPIDAGTANKNYSNDVLSRSEDFKDLMARDAIGATANDRLLETPPTSKNYDDPTLPPVALEPAPQAEEYKIPFNTLQDKYDRHADVVTNPTFTGVLKKAGVRLGTGVVGVWSTTGGKIAVILTGIVLVAGTVSLIYTYRAQIKTYYIQWKDWAFGGDNAS